jgi:putative Holliday junction resolvase
LSDPALTETRFMGIDYGEKRIGIALSDPTKTFSYSFVTLANDQNFVDNLMELVRLKNIIKIVIGLPSSNYKSSEKLAEKVRKLKQEFEIKSGIDVILWDEEYSSVIARGKVLDSVPRKSKRRDKGIIDRYSAAIILQEYLDNRPNNKSS